MDPEYTVSICVICYNQGNYIEETLKGILYQKSDFDIELIISNDCSTAVSYTHLTLPTIYSV